MTKIAVVVVETSLHLILMLGSKVDEFYSMRDSTTFVAGFAVVGYGFTFSLTDSLPIILSRSRADILTHCLDGVGEYVSPGDDFLI